MVKDIGMEVPKKTQKQGAAWKQRQAFSNNNMRNPFDMVARRVLYGIIPCLAAYVQYMFPCFLALPLLHLQCLAFTLTYWERQRCFIARFLKESNASQSLFSD